MCLTEISLEGLNQGEKSANPYVRETTTGGGLGCGIIPASNQERSGRSIKSRHYGGNRDGGRLERERDSYREEGP